ncbi:uncharacterized protein Z519_05184 [Cladophialophora bantiana CBS 173.52]|uniref:UBC core domain-containing protein n=1 Tax=Cladophialophora bantiana (strain ATCC 10958 / CBS 173.52 / CDC B-1940 / NIH 8579) TaxID=1442370 RepID=A0A0D2IAQ2_CLAB1|nr:uncharacterized protein Z519_05184 [Cladophialophora bantiana CBS 173.52]KIW93869.1 hypothetical protein Z519_05184 [Cladophialophora bantiana CBS 173.52]
MSPFDVSDHVALRQDVSLHGYVQRTHSQSIGIFAEEELIIAHVEVPPDILNRFLTTGVPPEGYVYVEFAHPTAGCSLVSQDDIVLISRSFRLGDYVKQDGSPLTGTVVDVSETYILDPVFANTLSASPTCLDTCPRTLPEHFTHPNPHILLYNVPAREVKRAQDVALDDFLIFGKWVGTARDVEYDTVVMLANRSVVVICGSLGLRMPLPDNHKPLIAVPELDGLWRPDILGATEGWTTTIPVTAAQCGDFVIIDRSSLRNGRWLHGSYDPRIPSQGIVIDIRTHNVMADWAIMGYPPPTNAGPPPRTETHIYENIHSHKSVPDLRLKADMAIYDNGKMPVKPADQRAFNNGAGSANGQASPDEVNNSRIVYSGHGMGVGVHVHFRDPSAARVKYQGIEGTSHGRFLPIQKDQPTGCDLNEYKIVFLRSSVTVMWQDGSVTTTDSKSLRTFALFEAEVLPTDIVLKREGMRQRPVNEAGKANGRVKDFDEMTFFEQPHDLLPTGVGVVQSVEPTEKVARVRWYKEPKIVLCASGQILAPYSWFGPIGDEIEDVSLFEIMSFPSLMMQRGSMCVLATEEKFQASDDGIRTLYRPELVGAAGWIREGSDSSMNADPQQQRALASCSSRAATPRYKEDLVGQLEWVGQIVSLGLDGSVTVRLGASEPCRDVVVHVDSIFAIFSDHMEEDPSNSSLMDIDSWAELSEGFAEPISESVEYEGGVRLDNDSGDENWVSDEDETFEDAEEDLQDVDGDLEMVDAGKQRGTTGSSDGALSLLEKTLGSEPPAQFLVVDREPPSDQFGLQNVSTAPRPLKRIFKEHQILATSLPEGEIYVRTYESRLDLLRCLIIGPKDTPYENAPFLIDLCLPAGFPSKPPTAHFHSWTSGLGRINPNLYEEGKICLSLLGTWSGKEASETWSPKATLLQLLVSLQGLVFVKKPFYNEAGFEGYEHDKAYTRESEAYSEKAFVISRGFVKNALLQPPGVVEDILAWLYLPHDVSNPAKSLLGTVVERGKLLLQSSEKARSNNDDSLVDSAGAKDDETKVFMKPLSRGAIVMLKRLNGELQALLDRFAAAK